MPVERVYQQQLVPQSTPGLPMASPDAFGAGIGESIGDLGRSLQHHDEVVRKVEADSQATDFNARFAATREELDKASIDARNNAAPGAAGHSAAMEALWKQKRDQLLAGISDRRILRAATEQADEFGARFGSSEYEFEAGARVGKMVTDTQATSDLAANRARRMHDPKSYAEELSLGRQGIDALEGVDAATKGKLHKYHDETVTVGYLNGLNDSNPQAAKALIDAGAFDSVLSPEQLDRARSGADIEIRRQQAEQNAQASAAKAEAREKIATVNARLEAGEEVPDGELVAASQMAQAIGDDSGAYKLDVAREKSGLARITQSWQPADWQREINGLRAKGDKRTGREDVQLKYLEQIAPGRIAEFNNDPGGYMARIGKPPPALSLADPASIAARTEWARAATATTGRPVPLLSKDEAALFSTRAASSPKEQLAVANELALFGGRSAQAAARQVSPSDPTLARLVLLNPNDRAATINGAAARVANRALIDGDAGNDARSDFYAMIGRSAALLSPQDLGAAFEVSRNLYADWAARNGSEGYDANRFKAIAQRALGGAPNARGVQEGGLGAWNGMPVLLPQGLSQAGFDGALSRYRVDPKSATAPVFADGTVMTAEQLRQYTPVQRPDGRYEFHDANDGVVMTKGRKAFVIDFSIRPGAPQ